MDPFTLGLILAGGGVATSALGQLTTALGTRQVPTGPTEAEIEAAIGAERRARMADIQRREERAARGVASRAAAGGVLESGLTARSMGDVALGAQAFRDALTAQLAQARIQAAVLQGYRPELTGWGIFGRGLAAAGAPLTMYGAAMLAGGMGPGRAAAGGLGQVANAAGGMYGTEAERAALAAPYADMVGLASRPFAQTSAPLTAAGGAGIPAMGAGAMQPFGFGAPPNLQYQVGDPFQMWRGVPAELSPFVSDLTARQPLPWATLRW